MKNDALYSVIIINYNNYDLLFTAIISVLHQNYSNIQLIISDDCSSLFDLNKVNNYISNNMDSNIKSVKFVINDSNIGTVATLGKCIDMCDGEYVLVFASDDELYDENVLSNYVTYFQKTGSNIIASQWRLCDSNLNFKKNYINSKKNKRLNNDIDRLYYLMCRYNLFGSGSVSYRKSIFNKYGSFNLNYNYLEDWPFWLLLLRNGELIYYADFNGLNHRTGGISTSVNNIKLVKRFRNEILNVFSNDIIPYYDIFNFYQKYQILKSYDSHIYQYIDTNNVSSHLKLLNQEIKKNRKIRILFIFKNYFPNIIEKIIILFKYNLCVPLSFIQTLMIALFFINNKYHNCNCIFILYLIFYIIFYIINDMFLNFIYLRRRIK